MSTTPAGGISEIECKEGGPGCGPQARLAAGRVSIASAARTPGTSGQGRLGRREWALVREADTHPAGLPRRRVERLRSAVLKG